MLAALIMIPWFAASSPTRTLFSLFVLSPLLNVSAAGILLHVVQSPYRALNSRPVAWLGRISYSLYLWQELFCSNAALHGGYFLVLPSIACACLSFYLVEQPMLQIRDRLKLQPTFGPRKSASPQELPVAREA